jgi:hypothetical protein
VATRLDLAGARRVVDVGSSCGRLLGTLLMRWPETLGALQVKRNPETSVSLFAEAGLSQRCQVVVGNCDHDMPPDGDVYLLNRVLGKRSNAQAGVVLDMLRKACADRGESSVIVLERVIADGPGFHIGKLDDLALMLSGGGRNRSEAEYRDLLLGHGFRSVEVCEAQDEPYGEIALVARA